MVSAKINGSNQTGQICRLVCYAVCIPVCQASFFACYSSPVEKVYASLQRHELVHANLHSLFGVFAVLSSLGLRR